MKKLSLVLALIFVLTCALVACGGDETETSSTAATSSEAQSKVESSAPASSEAESSEEPVSSEEEVSKEPVVIPETATNVASGAETIFISGTPSTTYTANLTDGVVADKVVYDPSWFGLGNGNKVDGDYAWVIIDLGASYKLYGGKIHVGFATADGAGVSVPYDVTFSFSEDGENFVGGSVVDMPTVEGANWAEKTFDAPVFARYIKVKAIPASWFFFDEVEVLGEAVA